MLETGIMIGIFLGAYLLLQVIILPRLGVPT